MTINYNTWKWLLGGCITAIGVIFVDGALHDGFTISGPLLWRFLYGAVGFIAVDVGLDILWEWVKEVVEYNLRDR